MQDNLTKFNACGAAITPAMVMVAMVEAMKDGETPAYARVHEAQRVAWHNCALMCNVIEINPKEFPRYPFTSMIGGVPMRLDNKLWPSTVVFHNADGKPVARIQGLAIPIGVGEEAPALWNCKDQAEYERRIIDEGWRFE